MDNKIEQVKKFELNYPKHHHPHGVRDTSRMTAEFGYVPNVRIYLQMLKFVIVRRTDGRTIVKCTHAEKGERCESHLEPYLLAPTLYSEPQVMPEA